MSDTERREELLAAELAADWLRRLKTGGPEVQAAFGRWLRESPRNVREILVATAYRHALEHMKDHHRVDVEALKARCAEQPHDIGQMASETRSRSRARNSSHILKRIAFRWSAPREAGRWKVAATVTFVALVSFMAIAIHAVSDRSITTGPGDWHTARLADGTVLRIGPRTRVSVDITEHERVLRLTRGEVMAYVAKDSARPFFVTTDLATARAVGTAFAVRHNEPGHVAIIVQEGTVAVNRDASSDSHKEAIPSSVLVTAGHGVFVAPDGRSLVSQPVDLRMELAWLEQMLVLNERSTIASVIHELNLRNRTQIKLVDPAMGQRPLRGTFAASDPESFARMLEQQLPVSVLEEDDTLVMVPHPTAGPVESRESQVR